MSEAVPTYGDLMRCSALRCINDLMLEKGCITKKEHSLVTKEILHREQNTAQRLRAIGSDRGN